jgi:biopolymer transport protein ExbD
MRIKIPETDSNIHLDFVPMVDTLFNLLIFFLLATTIKQAEREMQIALPHAAAAVPISVSLRELVVNVDAQGRMFVTGREVDEAALRDIVAQAVDANSEHKVTVRGDRTTVYANIVRVLDICKAAGVQEPYLDTVMLEGGE